MFRQISVGCLFAVCCLAVGCVEQSTVVKVKPDGSGIVHIRKHIQDSGFLQSGDKKKSPIPSEENVHALVAAIGKNARLRSLTKSVNHNRWSGYDLIIAYDDINQIVLPDNMDDYLKEDGPDSNDKQPMKMSFSYADGLLDIKTTGFADDPGKPKKEVLEGAVNPFAAEPSSPLATVTIPDAAMLQVIAKLAVDAKVGVFVQLDGEVTESNAKYRKGNLVTLMRVGVGEILDSPKSLAKLKQLEGNNLTRAAAIKIAESVKGFDADFQPSIKVRFQ